MTYLVDIICIGLILDLNCRLQRVEAQLNPGKKK